MNLEQLQQRLERVRGRIHQQFPQPEVGTDLADLCPSLVGEERLGYLSFIATIRDRFPGGVFTNESLAVALDRMTKEERMTFRAWLVKAEQRKNSEAVIELEHWRGW